VADFGSECPADIVGIRKLPTLELPDQEPQLLDLGLGRVPLGASSISFSL